MFSTPPKKQDHDCKGKCSPEAMKRLLTGQEHDACGTVSSAANEVFVHLHLLRSGPFSLVGWCQRSSIHPLCQGTGVIRQMRNSTVLRPTLPGSHSPCHRPRRRRCRSHGPYRSCSHRCRRSTRPSGIRRGIYQRREAG